MKPFKEFAAVQWAAIVDRQTRAWATKPFETQQRTLEQLTATAARTVFGRDHRFADVRSHQDLIQAVPVRDYEALRPYIFVSFFFGIVFAPSFNSENLQLFFE